MLLNTIFIVEILVFFCEESLPMCLSVMAYVAEREHRLRKIFTRILCKKYTINKMNNG